jgi:hypothetical protein
MKMVVVVVAVATPLLLVVVEAATRHLMQTVELQNYCCCCHRQHCRCCWVRCLHRPALCCAFHSAAGKGHSNTQGKDNTCQQSIVCRMRCLVTHMPACVVAAR